MVVLTCVSGAAKMGEASERAEKRRIRQERLAASYFCSKCGRRHMPGTKIYEKHRHS
jgi:hypothetical protein